MPNFLTLFFRYVLALGTGIALSYAYAPYNVAYLAWFFPVVLLILVWSLPRVTGKNRGRRNFRAGFFLAFVAGFGFWMRDVAFIGAVSKQGGWASSGGLALYLSLFFGLYGGWANTVGKIRRLQDLSQPSLKIITFGLMHGFLWCGLEWSRGLSRLSFGWDGLGVSFLEKGRVIAQAADLVGVNGLSFLLVFGGVVLVLTSQTFYFEAKHGRRRVHWEVLCALLLLVLTFTYGTFRWQQLKEEETVGLNALIIQQDIPLSFSWKPELADEVYGSYASEMEKAFEGMAIKTKDQLEMQGEALIPRPDLVLFPESALPHPLWVDASGRPLEEQDNKYFYDSVVRPYGDFLFICGVNQFPALVHEDGVELDDSGLFYNAMGFFSSDFLSYRMKPKNHLMPFGEYMPLEQFSLFQIAYAYSAGVTFGGSFTPAQTFEPEHFTRKGLSFSLVPTVCYEDTVSTLVRKYLRDEPQIIINVTNDGWFRGTACAEKHFQNACFRAIEYRRPLVRAANTGVSAIIDVMGGLVHSETGIKQEIRDAKGSTEIKGHLNGVVEIPQRPLYSFYALTGDVFCWGGLLIVCVFSCFEVFKKSYERA